MSSWPRWTPSASTAKAMSILSLIKNKTLFCMHSFFISKASFTMLPADASFSLYCMTLTPDSIADFTSSITDFLVSLLSVMKYNPKSSIFIDGILAFLADEHAVVLLERLQLPVIYYGKIFFKLCPEFPEYLLRVFRDIDAAGFHRKKPVSSVF